MILFSSKAVVFHWTPETVTGLEAGIIVENAESDHCNYWGWGDTEADGLY